MTQDYDVLIIGGGLAGQCLALALHHTDLKIAIVEAYTQEALQQSPAGDRALALAKGSVEMLENLGIWQKAVDSATAIKHIHISDQGHFAKTRLSAEKQQVDALGYVITARDLEQQVAALMATTTIEQISPARLEGIATDEQGAYISLRKDDESFTVSTKLLVGADGGQSTVRKLLAIQQTITDYQQSAIVTTIKTALPHQHIAYERFTSSGPLALLPLKDDYAVVWTRKSEEAEQLVLASEAEFIEQLQACFGYKLGQFSLVSARRLFPLQLIRADTMHQQRAVIIGNAAHQLHPVAGQGFNLGLRDVMQLAEAILVAIEKNEDIGAESLLQNYVQQRVKDHNQVIQFTDGVVKLFSNDFLPLAVARNAGLALLDTLPQVKSHLAQSAMGLKVS